MAASYESMFGGILAAIDAEMRAVRQQQVEIAPLLWEMLDHHFGWGAGTSGFQPGASGKRVRPLLMALVAQAISGEYRHVLPAAAALEFLHNFTLIHDDVMDHSAERRHRPTVWALWGGDQAINAGDGLYALANLAVANLLHAEVPASKAVRAAQVLAQACLWTAEGQVLDMSFAGREQVTTAEYLTMIAHKTGGLLEAATKIGALLSSDDEPVIRAYAQFGRDLGLAFQVRDDYLGVWGDEAATGKSATGDIREKKKSYPVLVAFERAAAADQAVLRRIYAQEALSDEDVADVLDILERSGAIAETDRSASEYFERALAHLDATGIANPTQDGLRQLAAFLIRRAY
ncbi:MAG: polyprenyl synthetase family protein [Anaerolineae bacterium]|nr:polyprenyl synthetase family protein [Anaerolineae bacterium]